MGSTDRAAQFAPFAALNGHGEAVEETARTTSYKIELDEYRLKEVNDELKNLLLDIKSKPLCKITYFIKDKYKLGGQYITKVVKVLKVYEIERCIALEDQTKIKFEDIFQIEKIKPDSQT